MIEVRLKYLYRDVDRHGNERLYFWRKRGPKIRIRETQGSEAFLTVYKELLQAAERGGKPFQRVAGTRSSSAPGAGCASRILAPLSSNASIPAPSAFGEGRLS